jgi:hypothetical protein
MERATRIASCLLWAAVVFGPAVSGLAQSPAPASAPSQTVLVTLTTRGMRPSQTTLRPGAVRFTMVNQTPRPGLRLLVSPAASGSDKLDSATAIQPSNTSGGQRPSIDVTLAAGTYTLWLSQAPAVTATITVVPGGVE